MEKTLITLLLASLVTPFSAHGDKLTLADALARRNDTSHVLKMAKLDELIAGDSITANRSGYLPRIDFQGGYAAQLEPQSVNTPFSTFQTQDRDYAFASLGITQTIYDFGRTGNRVRQAEALHSAAYSGYRSQEQEQFLRTVTSYFLILQEQKLLAAADDEMAQMTDHLRVAKNLYEEGVVTRNDLLQAEVRLASSTQKRLATCNRLENAWLDLNNQIGAPPEARAELVEETKIDPVALNEPAAQAVVKRPELETQRRLLEAREADVKETRSGYLPELFAKLGLDYVQNSHVQEQTIYSATVGLKINLFDGLATTASHRQAVKSRSRAEVELHQLESDLALEFRTAVNDARVAKERIALSETSINQGEENLRINKDRYAEQVGTATDVIDAQTLLSQVRAEHFQAIFDYEVALARVKRARGEL